MAVNIEALIIKSKEQKTNSELLKIFGLSNLELNRSTEKNGNFSWKSGWGESVVIGRHKNYTIVFSDIPMKYFSDKIPSKKEGEFCKIFKEDTLLAIANYGTAMVYFYSLIENGKRIRTKSGGFDEGLKIDSGVELIEEKELYDSKNKEGDIYIKKYIIKNDKTGEITEHVANYKHEEIGGSMAFNICKRLMGINFSDLSEEDIQYYEYILSTEIKHNATLRTYITSSKSRLTAFQGKYLNTNNFNDEIVSKLLPILKKYGFEYNKSKMLIFREIGDFKHTIKFAQENDIGNKHFKFNPNLFASISSLHLVNWWQQEYGTTHWNPANDKVTVPEVLDISINLYDDKRLITVSKEKIELTYEEIVLTIGSYIQDTIIPIFDYYSTHKIIANSYNSGLLKIDYLISLKEYTKAKDAIRVFLKQLNFPNNNPKYNSLLDHILIRVKKYNLGDDLEDIFKLEVQSVEREKFDVNSLEITFEGFPKLEDRQSEIFDSIPVIDSKSIKEIEIITEKSSKKWWRFW